MGITNKWIDPESFYNDFIEQYKNAKTLYGSSCNYEQTSTEILFTSKFGKSFLRLLGFSFSLIACQQNEEIGSVEDNANPNELTT